MMKENSELENDSEKHRCKSIIVLYSTMPKAARISLGHKYKYAAHQTRKTSAFNRDVYGSHPDHANK
jgi:hypothetical protein